MKSIILCALTLVFSSSAFAYSCTISDIKSNNPKFCDDLREESPLTEDSMRELFTEIQNYMKDFILKGRRVENLSPEEKSVYARISTVQFSKFNPCGNDRDGKPVVTAAYSTTTHSVTVCEGLKNFPRPALVAMIGHEIGHSGDSCSVQCYHVHAENRTRLRLPDNFLQGPDSDPEMQNELRSSNKPISLTGRFLMSRPEVVEGWREIPGVTINDPMPLNRYPLNRVRRCLIDQDKVWEAPKDEPSDQVARNRDTGPGCKSHTDFESMADVWGGYALGKYFEKHPEKHGAAALGMFESRKKELCSRKSYTEIVARQESIWMAAPGVAQALGCTPVPERNCMNQPTFPASLHTPQNTISSSTSNIESTNGNRGGSQDRKSGAR